MATDSGRHQTIRDLAKAYLLAKSAFNRAYCRFWEAEVRPCSDETGWKLLETFHGEVEDFRFKRGREEMGIKSAAWELFQCELVGDADYTFEDAVGFVKWYERLRNKVGSAIAHLYEYHGDSFGDLIDAYPLAGRDLIVRALASHPESSRPRREGFLDERELDEAVREKLGPAWHSLVCRGENYIASTLEAGCYRCYLHRILTGRDKSVTWTEDEQSAADFAGHYDH